MPDESIFRKQFVAALNGDGDMNSDGYVTGTELGEFLYDTVANYSKGTQHPQYGKIRDPNLDKGDFVFKLLASPPQPLVMDRVKITKPKDKVFVGDSETVTGTYTEEIKDDIWVALWPELVPDRCYPQSDDPAAGAPASKRKGKWSVICHFGGPPQSFEIVVYTATPFASQFI